MTFRDDAIIARQQTQHAHRHSTHTQHATLMAGKRPASAPTRSQSATNLNTEKNDLVFLPHKVIVTPPRTRVEAEAVAEACGAKLTDPLVHEGRVVSAIGRALEDLARANDTYINSERRRGTGSSSKLMPAALSAFEGRSKIRLITYLWRLVCCINDARSSVCVRVSPGLRSLVIAMLYLDRLSIALPGFVVSSSMAHRLCLIAIMTSTKVVEDAGLPMSFWVHAGGVSGSEVRRLEHVFVTAIGFDLFVSDEEFWCYFGRFSTFARASGVPRSISGVSLSSASTSASSVDSPI